MSDKFLDGQYIIQQRDDEVRDRYIFSLIDAFLGLLGNLLFFQTV